MEPSRLLGIDGNVTATMPMPVTSKPFDEVAIRELPILYRVAKRLTRNPQLAEDIVGQTLLNAAKAWANFDGRHPRSWLIRILRNEFFAQHRTARQNDREIEETDAIDQGPWHDIETKAAHSAALEALDTLPEEYRMAVALCDMEEMSYEDAAAAMEVPVGTVRSRLFRGRKMLRQKLISFGEDQ